MPRSPPKCSEMEDVWNKEPGIQWAVDGDGTLQVALHMASVVSWYTSHALTGVRIRLDGSLPSIVTP